MALALADLDLVFHRHEDLEDLVVHAHRFDAMLEVRLDLVLVARVGVDDVPALLGRPNGLASLLRLHVLKSPAADARGNRAEDDIEEGDVQTHDEADSQHQHGEVASLLRRRPVHFLQFLKRFYEEAADP